MKTRILAVGLCVLFPVVVQAASFDCAKAGTSIEKLICSTPALSEQDEQLAAVYKKALDTTADKAALKQQQVTWLKTRNACADAECLMKAYQARVSELTVVPASVVNPLAPKAPAPIGNPLTFKLVFGDSYPICQSYIDMLQRAKFSSFTELACKERVLNGFSQFKAIEWKPVSDTAELLDGVERGIKLRYAINNDKDSVNQKYAIDQMKVTILEKKQPFYKHEKDLNGDEINETVYKTVIPFSSEVIPNQCEKYNFYFFIDSKINPENAKDHYMKEYFSFNLPGDNQLFYASDSLYNSSWSGDVISAGSNLDIYSLDSKKICGILVK